ncbi:MAG: NAD-dependent epimerase/dehydratase family protein [Desulfobacterales bacterium]|jgi:dihydroflavonol-4-reductase
MNLVTGASGFIGGRIVHALIQRGEAVRILTRAGSDLKGISGLSYELVTGDILERNLLEKAVRGCRRIYHTAALYKLWLRNRGLIHKINIEGTRNVIRAGMAANVERIVYTSSVATIGLPAKGLGTEDTPVCFQDMIGEYKKSKFLAEQAVKDYIQKGAPVVIVNPTFPVGEGDIKPTPSGQVILDFLKKRMPAYLDTGMNVVDVDDVAAGHLLAADKGRIGRRYILGNENLTFQQLLQILADLTGLPAPSLKLPYYPILGLAHLDAALAKLVPGREPRIPPDGVRMARKKMFVDPSRAVKELNLPRTSPRIALEKAVNWFRRNGYV